jgi:hypothetical protein
MTPTDRAKARALCDEREMNEWDGVDRLLPDVKAALSAALDDLDRLTESRDDNARLHRAAVAQRENLRRILQETVGAFVLHGYDVARILGSELAAEVELEAEHDGTAQKGGSDG